MKEFRITYRDNYIAEKEKRVDIIAETEQDANNFFFEHYSGIIFRTEFVGWA